MPTESSKARSPSPGSSKQILCIDDQSLNFSKDHHRQSQNHKPSLTSGREQPGLSNVVVQVVLAPRWRRRHESTNRAGQLWACPGHPYDVATKRYLTKGSCFTSSWTPGSSRG